MYIIVILYSNVKFTGETIEYDLGQVLQYGQYNYKKSDLEKWKIHSSTKQYTYYFLVRIDTILYLNYILFLYNNNYYLVVWSILLLYIIVEL